MSRELFILRHCKSDWDNEIRLDSARPLSERGRKDALKLGVWMQQHSIKPQLVLCSSAARTRETLALLNRALHLPASSTHYANDLYLASLQMLLTSLERVDRSYRSVLLIGHNPGLDQLVSYISRTVVPLTQSGKLMTTGCLAHFDCQDDWRELQQQGKLVAITRPTDIKED